MITDKHHIHHPSQIPLLQQVVHLLGKLVHGEQRLLELMGMRSRAVTLLIHFRRVGSDQVWSLGVG